MNKCQRHLRDMKQKVSGINLIRGNLVRILPNDNGTRMILHSR